MERRANTLLAQASVTITPWVLRGTIRTQFSNVPAGFRDKRYAAYLEVYNLTEAEIEIDEVTVTVVLANQLWMQYVYFCQVGGGCNNNDDYGSLIYYYTSPVGP